MKNAILFHGTSSSPNSFWFPYLKLELEKEGYQVSVPSLPDADHPDLKNWLPKALKEHFTENTVLVGHSAGAPLILSILENINIKIKLAILVAGYARPKGQNPQPEAILQSKYSWQKIKSKVKTLVFINSDNDPWGCNDKEGEYMQKNLGGKLIILKGEGHMGSDSFSQPYKQFPPLLELILK